MNCFSVFLFALAFVLAALAVIFSRCCEGGTNIDVVFATLAGAIATCSMFAYQKYEFEEQLKARERRDYFEKSSRLLEKLKYERDKVVIRYPAIDKSWQEKLPRPKAKGVNAFYVMLHLADSLRENFSNTVYLNYNEDHASSEKERTDEDIQKYQNCTDNGEYEFVLESQQVLRKQMRNGLYNVFFEINEEVYNLNVRKDETTKRGLCAYYMLNKYEKNIEEYLNLLNKISEMVNTHKSIISETDIQAMYDDIETSLSVAEMRLIKDYLVFKKKNLKNLFKE